MATTLRSVLRRFRKGNSDYWGELVEQAGVVQINRVGALRVRYVADEDVAALETWLRLRTGQETPPEPEMTRTISLDSPAPTQSFAVPEDLASPDQAPLTRIGQITVEIARLNRERDLLIEGLL